MYVRHVVRAGHRADAGAAGERRDAHVRPVGVPGLHARGRAEQGVRGAARPRHRRRRQHRAIAGGRHGHARRQRHDHHDHADTTAPGDHHAHDGAAATAARISSSHRRRPAYDAAQAALKAGDLGTYQAKLTEAYNLAAQAASIATGSPVTAGRRRRPLPTPRRAVDDRERPSWGRSLAALGGVAAEAVGQRRQLLLEGDLVAGDLVGDAGSGARAAPPTALVAMADSSSPLACSAMSASDARPEAASRSSWVPPQRQSRPAAERVEGPAPRRRSPMDSTPARPTARGAGW